MKDGRSAEVQETLARLGIEEVTERLEISPLLASDDGALEDPTPCCHCVCKYVPIELPRTY